MVVKTHRKAETFVACSTKELNLSLSPPFSNTVPNTEGTVFVTVHCIYVTTWQLVKTVSRAKTEICACDWNGHLQTKIVKSCSLFYVSSLRGNTVSPPPRPLHLHLPADVIPGCGNVLHGPPAPTASVRGAGGCPGCLPGAHETASVGLLDMADHAVTETDHRWRHRACFIFFQTLLFSFFERSPGPQTP